MNKQCAGLWLVVCTTTIALTIFMTVVTNAKSEHVVNRSVAQVVPTLTPMRTLTRGEWSFSDTSSATRPKKPKIRLCRGCNEGPQELLDTLRAMSIEMKRETLFQIPYDVDTLESENKLVVVLIDMLQGEAEILAILDSADYAIDGETLDIGSIPNNAAAGIYLLNQCPGDCASENLEDFLNDTVYDAVEGTVFARPVLIPPKTKELDTVVQTVDSGAAPYIGVTWQNTYPGIDNIELVWSEDGNVIATYSEQIFGYLDASGTGTRLYNTPLINIAPLAPAFAPELAEELPPGTYQVDLYVNSALEGVQTIVVDAP